MTDPDSTSDLDDGLRAAFGHSGSERGESTLAAIQRLHGVGSKISLRETEEAHEPLALKRTATEDSRYQSLGEIARGGIGIVYKCLDRDLNRNVAVKVLRPEYADRQDVLQRFVEEAQIGGQLQHPGIVPIYGIDLQNDGRPSFAMKLIKGQTLAQLMADRQHDTDLFEIFEQVTQTIAYAHSRGVLHRDLKPANVMIGSFGEVQVVDWGFAKLIGQDEVQAPERTIIATVRSQSEGSQSVAGSVMGTPAYMPPEQALGMIDELDERADVFALGAILCEILTSEPVYGGEQVDQIVAATRCDTTDALERLASVAVDEELKGIVRDCLQATREQRPASAEVLARRFSTYRSAVEQRARRSELAAIEAERNASRQRGRRLAAVAIAATLMVSLACAWMGYSWWQADRDARWAKVTPLVRAALDKASAHEGNAAWPRAIAAARRGLELANNAGMDASAAKQLHARLVLSKEAADQEARRVAEERDFVKHLDDIRVRHARGALDAAATDASYHEAFTARYGSLAAAAAGMSSSPHHEELAAHLDAWALLRHLHPADRDTSELVALADGLTPGRAHARSRLLAGPVARLEFARAQRATATATSRTLFSQALLADQQPDEALALLDHGLTHAIANFWLHVAAGSLALQTNDAEIAIRHATAAVACRPHNAEAWQLLADAFAASSDQEGERTARQRATQLVTNGGSPR